MSSKRVATENLRTSDAVQFPQEQTVAPVIGRPSGVHRAAVVAPVIGRPSGVHRGSVCGLNSGVGPSAEFKGVLQKTASNEHHSCRHPSSTTLSPCVRIELL